MALPRVNVKNSNDRVVTRGGRRTTSGSHNKIRWKKEIPETKYLYIDDDLTVNIRYYVSMRTLREDLPIWIGSMFCTC